MSVSLTSRREPQTDLRVAENNLKVAPAEIKWHSGLPIYASEAFLKSLGDQYGWLGGTDIEGRLRCVVAYTVIRKFGFRLVRFRTETLPLGNELDLAEEKGFLNGVVEYFRSAGIDLIVPSGNSAIFRTFPDGAISAPYGTIVNDLRQPEESLWSEVQTDYRQNIRKAMKVGVQVHSGLQYLDISHAMIAGTLKRSGVAFRKYDDFKARVQALGDNVKIFVADCGGVIQACMVAPFSEKCAYDWYSGTTSKPARGAMHLLLWESMRQFREMGVGSFDFQGVRISPDKGSKQEGILNFKKRFGGQLVQGYLWKYPFQPLKWTAYSLGVRLLMGGDIVDQERNRAVPAPTNSSEVSPITEGTASPKHD